MFIRALDQAICKFLCFAFGIMLALSLFFKAMYSFDDSPYFTRNNWIDLLALMICLIFYYLIYRFAGKIEKIHTAFLWTIFGAIALIYIFMVPLAPFSDMYYVDYGAKLIGEGKTNEILGNSYLQMISKNLKVAFFYSLFLRILPATTFSIKCVNVLCYLFTIHFISKISDNFDYKYPKNVFILGGTFLPALLYCNHVYFDLPTLCFCVLGVYFYTRHDRKLLIAAIFLGIACCLRVLAYIFVIAVLLDFLFRNCKVLFENHCRKLVVFLLSTLIIACTPIGVNDYVNRTYRTADAQNESIWTLFCMGINEAEFGFMHNEILNGEKSFQDFSHLLLSRDITQNTKLFSRKILWTWTQGTYQAERYGFGNNATVYSEKFEYETVATRFLMNEDQILRKTINAVCRAEYLLLFGLMVMDMWNLDAAGRDRFRIFYYLLFGTLLILIFYEMKSRYIFSCVPAMLLFAARGGEMLSTKRMHLRSQEETVAEESSTAPS